MWQLTHQTAGNTEIGNLKKARNRISSAPILYVYFTSRSVLSLVITNKYPFSIFRYFFQVSPRMMNKKGSLPRRTKESKSG